jgi:hypothetical protein
MVWDYQRIKYALRREARTKLLTDLEEWNRALSLLLLENTDGELILDAPSSDNTPSPVRELQSRFDIAECQRIRDAASCIYNACTRIWRCQCLEHTANMISLWHTSDDENCIGQRVPEALAFEITITSDQFSRRKWHTIAISFEVKQVIGSKESGAVSNHPTVPNQKNLFLPQNKKASEVSFTSQPEYLQSSGSKAIRRADQQGPHSTATMTTVTGMIPLIECINSTVN